MSGPDREAGTEGAAIAARTVDPQAVRVALAGTSARPAIEPIVVEPGGDGVVLIDGLSIRLRLNRFDAVHAVFVEEAGDGEVTRRTPIIVLPAEGPPGHGSGVARREVVVGAWRFEVEIESERHTALRARARRGREEAARGGPIEVRAIIPGRIASVSVVAGDAVEAGQQLLVVEAMKMQNELRAPRDGIVTSVAVGAGGTIEVGDLMLVLE